MKKMMQTGMKMTELFWRLSPPHSSPSQFLVLILTSWRRRPSIQLSSIRYGPWKSDSLAPFRGCGVCVQTGPHQSVPQQVCGDRDGLSTIGKSRSCSFPLLLLACGFGETGARAERSRRAAVRGRAASATRITVINEVLLSRLRLKSLSLLLD